MVNLFLSIQKFQALPSQSPYKIIGEMVHRELLRGQEEICLPHLWIEFLSGQYFMFRATEASRSTVASQPLCQGCLILGSHSATCCYFSFQRAFPTILSCSISNISVTCT